MDGHYQFHPPFREHRLSLPNKSFLPLQRLKSSKTKFTQKPEFQKYYNLFMQTLMDRGFPEKVPESELERSDVKTWYLPHDGVYHMRKKKIRVYHMPKKQSHGSI